MYLTVLLWSLLIFAAFWGYGKLCFHFLPPSTEKATPDGGIYGWGLTASLGLSVVTLLGGVLMLAGLAFPKTLSLVTWVGVLTALYFGAAGFKDKRWKSFRLHHPTDLILIALTLLTFLTSIYWQHQIDPNDDWIAYLMFPERILQTGTFVDTFSLRRVQALGGQSFLQAMIMIVGAPENGHILDRGFGALLLLGLLFAITRQTPKNWWFVRFLVILAAVSTSIPRISTPSHALGLTLLLAMVCLLFNAMQVSRFSWQHLLAVALTLASASTLRPMYAIAGGLTIVAYSLIATSQAPKSFWKNSRVLFLTGGLTILLLLPYMILSWKSSGTPMFPLLQGTANTEQIFGATKEGGWADWAGMLNFFVSPEIIVLFLGMLVFVFLPISERSLALAVGGAALLTVLLSGFKMSAASFYDVYRYTFPLAGFAFFWILGRLVASEKLSAPIQAPLSAGLAICLYFSAYWASIANEFRAKFQAIKTQTTGFTFVVAQLKPFYNDLQNRLPIGEKIFAIVDAPYLLDFSRNPIDCIDSPGGASPRPGMPFGKGPQALKDYLIKQGFRYVFCVDFNNAVQLYTRKLHENHPRPEWYMKVISKKYFMDFFDNMDAIATDTEVARAGNVRLLDLQKKAEPQLRLF